MTTLSRSPNVPSENGVGAALDVSDLGPLKAIVVRASGHLARAQVLVEGRHTDGGPWGLIAHFDTRGSRIVEATVRDVRVRVKGYKRGAFSVDIGAESSGGTFVTLPVPSGNGVGASVDVSGLGTSMTAIVGGEFAGTVTVEVSNDGNDWGQLMGTVGNGGGVLTGKFPATYARVRRSGYRSQVPGSPSVTLGGAFDVHRREAYQADEFITTTGPKLLATESDPSSGGLAAPQGSLALQTDGSMWVKTGAGDTAWQAPVPDNPTFESVTLKALASGPGNPSSGFNVFTLASGLNSNQEFRLKNEDGENVVVVHNDGTTWRAAVHGLDINHPDRSVFAPASIRIYGGGAPNQTQGKRLEFRDNNDTEARRVYVVAGRSSSGPSGNPFIGFRVGGLSSHYNSGKGITVDEQGLWIHRLRSGHGSQTSPSSRIVFLGLNSDASIEHWRSGTNTDQGQITIRCNTGTDATHHDGGVLIASNEFHRDGKPSPTLALASQDDTGLLTQWAWQVRYESPYGSGGALHLRRQTGGTVNDGDNYDDYGSILQIDSTGGIQFNRGSEYRVSIAGEDDIGIKFPAGTDMTLENGDTSLTLGPSLIVLTPDTRIDLLTSVRVGGAGNTVGFFGVTPAAQPAALTAADGSAVNSGDATTDTVIDNIRTRLGELESRVTDLGLIAA